MSEEKKTILNRIQQKLGSKSKKPEEIKQSFLNKENRNGNDSFGAARPPSSLPEFNKLLTTRLAQKTDVANIQFGKYETDGVPYFRAEIAKGKNKIIATCRYGAAKPEFFLPEEEKKGKFTAFAAGQHFEDTRQNEVISSEATGGAWNEVRETRKYPVFEFSADGQISHIGNNIVRQTVWHGNGGAGAREDSRIFQSLEEERQIPDNKRARENANAKSDEKSNIAMMRLMKEMGGNTK